MDNRTTLVEIREAAGRIRPHAHRTPVLVSESINRQVNAHLWFKCENFQKTGSFKFRGASNAVFSLPDQEASRGVATHSSGNHGQALARAARSRGIPAFIVMPSTSRGVKRAAVAGYGGQVTFCEPTLEARESTLAEIVERTGATPVHPYDDDRVIAGQGTAALELLSDFPDLEVVMAPVSGGGLLAGTGAAVGGASPDIQVIGAEPEADDDAFRSLQSGSIQPAMPPNTVADGLAGVSLGRRNFSLIQEHVSRIVTVSEEAIVEAMRMMWERTKIVVEPSAAVPLGVLLEEKVDLVDACIGIIVSGGNVDLDGLPWVG